MPMKMATEVLFYVYVVLHTLHGKYLLPVYLFSVVEQRVMWTENSQGSHLLNFTAVAVCGCRMVVDQPKAVHVQE